MLLTSSIITNEGGIKLWFCVPFAGMTVHDFLSFPSLQEVECSGQTLEREVDFLSLTLFKISDNSLIATVKTTQNTCHTHTEYASCTIDAGNIRQSVARTLVADLHAGQTVVLGCNVTTVYKSGHPRVYTWSIQVHHKRKTCG